MKKVDGMKVLFAFPLRIEDLDEPDQLTWWYEKCIEYWQLIAKLAKEEKILQPWGERVLMAVLFRERYHNDIRPALQDRCHHAYVDRFDKAAKGLFVGLICTVDNGLTEDEMGVVWPQGVDLHAAFRWDNDGEIYQISISGD